MRTISNKVGAGRKAISTSAGFWFTLAELIVVIAILAVLATIGFIALSWYVQDARDAAMSTNVRSVYSVIATESASTGNHPRYYVIHDDAVALSWATLKIQGMKPTILTGGMFDVPGTNYSAGRPDYAKLKLDPKKFEMALRGSSSWNLAYAESSSGILVGATELEEESSTDSTSFFQVAAILPESQISVVLGGFPTLKWSVTGLIDADSDKTTLDALVDGEPVSGSSSGGDSVPAPEVPNGPTPVQLAAGTNFFCAILSDGRVKCWGENAAGQLANGTTSTPQPPAVVPELFWAAEIRLWANFGCARFSDGGVKCWGTGTNGRLGNNSTASSYLPVSVLEPSGTPLNDAVSLHVTANNACVVNNLGKLKCWGNNDSGKVKADGSTWGDIKTAYTVASLTGSVASVALGMNHSCVSLSDGVVKCWGLNNAGQIGDGTVIARYSPVTVMSGADKLFPGGHSNFSCAKMSDWTVKCWGSGGVGEIGNSTLSFTNSSPQAVTGISTADAIMWLGYGRTYLRLSNGSVVGWGSANSTYQPFWPGVSTNQSSPMVLEMPAWAAEVASGWSASCLRTTADVKCWGANNNGQLGDGTVGGRTEMASVPGLFD